MDDHEVARAGLQSILSRERDLEVAGEASDGQQAIALCRRLRPDLVLMDVRMPDMNGLAVTRTITEQHPGTSVIIFTIYENPDHLLEALRLGAAGYLLKGASRVEILAAIRQVLAGESLLHPELVLQLLHRLAGTAEAPVRVSRLTRREQDVLKLVAVGQTNREIAAILGINASTVKSHVEHLIAKLGVSDRTQAAVRGSELGLVSATRE